MQTFPRIPLVTLLALAALAPASAVAQKKSVNPGINKSFESPDVKQFVSRFERDGRDAYDHRDQILKACGLKPGMQVADVGAGTGLFTRLFAPRVGETGKVYAVDISDEFIEHIQKLAAAEKLTNVETVLCAQDTTRLPPESVDLVFICDTYHHFEFPYKTMQSIHRALKPDGKVILIDFERIEGKSSEWIMGHVRAGKEVFVKEIEEAGFKKTKERPGILKESYFLEFSKANSPGESAAAKQ